MHHTLTHLQTERGRGEGGRGGWEGEGEGEREGGREREREGGRGGREGGREGGEGTRRIKEGRMGKRWKGREKHMLKTLNL